MSTVYVCPERDIECGRREANWCASCPQRRASPAAAVPDAMPPPDDVSYRLRKYATGEWCGAEGYRGLMRRAADEIDRLRAAVEADRAQRPHPPRVTPEMFDGLKSSMKLLEEAQAAREAQIARLAGYADRAQQGEPVYFVWDPLEGGWDETDVDGYNATIEDARRILYERAATKAPAPADADELPKLRERVAHLEAMLSARLERKPDDSQQWAKIDGAIAFHLIERHADDWNDAGRMMDAWRDANQRAAPVPDTGIPVATDEQEKVVRLAGAPADQLCIDRVQLNQAKIDVVMLGTSSGEEFRDGVTFGANGLHERILQLAGEQPWVSRAQRTTIDTGSAATPAPRGVEIPAIAKNFRPAWQIDLQFRSEQRDWPKKWRLKQMTIKNSRADFRRTDFFDTLEEALKFCPKDTF